MKLSRTAFIITQKCTLKCKLCIGFIPYIKNPKEVLPEESKVILHNYFSMVDSVDYFTLTGGEPLLNSNFDKIILNLLEYKDRIQKSIDIVTNGTIPLKKEIVDILIKNKDKIRVIISDYGPLSVNIKKVVEVLSNNNINYKIHKYHGINLLYDGWVDFNDHSLKHKNLNEVELQAESCFFRAGKYYVIDEGELHLCHRSFWRMKNGIIKSNDSQYMDLKIKDYNYKIDGTNKLKEMNQIVYLDSCAYCNGATKNVKRYIPAEQLE